MVVAVEDGEDYQDSVYCNSNGSSMSRALQKLGENERTECHHGRGNPSFRQNEVSFNYLLLQVQAWIKTRRGELFALPFRKWKTRR